MLQILLNGIIVGGIYALIAIGFNLLYSAVRFYHLAYGPLAIFGAYFTWLLQARAGINFFLAAPLAALTFGLVGMLLWLIVYRPLRSKNASDLTMLVASFGILIVLQNLIALIFGNQTKSVSLTDTIIPGRTFGPLTITFNQLMILITSLICGLLFEFILKKTRLGAAIRAVGQNQELAMIIGIKSEHIIRYTFFVATALSVIGASLISLEIGLRPPHSLTLILKVVIACIIGGIGSVKGAIFGGLLLGIAENFGIFYFGAAWQEVVSFSVLILFLLFKPRGLFGSSS